jgi:hypothetical protein
MKKETSKAFYVVVLAVVLALCFVLTACATQQPQPEDPVPTPPIEEPADPLPPVSSVPNPVPPASTPVPAQAPNPVPPVLAPEPEQYPESQELDGVGSNTTGVVTKPVDIRLGAGDPPATPSISSTTITVAPPAITPTNQYILDWSNRNLGEPYAPDWLKDLVRGNPTKALAAYGLNESETMIRYTVVNNVNRNVAMSVADANYAAQLANELKRTVNTQIGAFLNAGDFAALNRALSETKITLVGHKRLVDFWQLVETRNTMTNEPPSREYIYYIVYAVDQVSWQKMVDGYLREVINTLPPEATPVVAEAVEAAAPVIAATTIEPATPEMSEEEFLQQLADLNQALQVPMSTDSQQAAYAAGNPARAAAASIMEEDYEWIRGVTEASEVLYQ